MEKKDKNCGSWLNGTICRLFHSIETINHCSFVDVVSGESVGKFECKRCDVVYLANNKRDIFRCYL